MRPRTLGRIAIAVLCVMAVLTSLIYAASHGATAHDNARALTFAILALVFATLYRYFED